MNLNLLRKFTFFACLLLSSPLFAADAPKVTFRALSMAGDVGGIYFTNSKGEPEEFRANDYIRSLFYRTQRGEELAFYKLIPAEKDGEEPTREVVGSIKWPTGKGPFLVLVTQRGESYDFSVAEDDEGSFPIGSFRVINASRHEVYVRAGDITAGLDPGASAVLKPVSPGENKGIHFQVAMKSIPDRLLYTNAWPRTQITRTLVFVFNRPFERHPIGVRRIQENDRMLKSQRAKEAQEEKEAKTR